jgi:hypothetical protein
LVAVNKIIFDLILSNMKIMIIDMKKKTFSEQRRLDKLTRKKVEVQERYFQMKVEEKESRAFSSIKKLPYLYQWRNIIKIKINR